MEDNRKGLSLGEISKRYGLKRSTVQYIISSYGNHLKKRGPKEKITKNDRRHIQTILNSNKINNGKCSSLDIIKDLNLNMSRSTVYRSLKCMKFNYKKLPNKFALTYRMRQKRVQCARVFITKGISWNSVIFTDEKLFTLHGTDSFYSWIQGKQSSMRMKQVVRSPGLMVWAMLMPNGLLSYEILTGRQRSANYIHIIKTKALPIIKLNIKENFIFQQDNCPIHISKESLNFFQQEHVELLDWPPYSPDINIIENVWSMLSSEIYGGGSIKNLKELRIRIHDSVTNFNETKIQTACKLYNSMPSRLCSILEKHGQRIQY